jgi:O-antigen ligase
MVWLLSGYIWLYLHRPFEYWTFLGDIRLERIYMIFLIVAWAFQPGKVWSFNRLYIAIFFLTVAIFGAWFSSPFPQELGEKVWDDNWKVATLFVLLVTSIRDEKQLRQLLILFFVAMFLYKGHSFWEFLNGKYEYRMKTVRMKGVDKSFEDPNTFSATLLHVLPFLLPFWMTPRGPNVRRWIAAYTLFTLLCVVLTGSRRAMLGSLFLAFILVMYSKRRWSLLLLGAMMAPVGWFAMRDDLKTRFLTIIDPSVGPSNAQTSANSRVKFFWDGMRLWGQHPILGVGPGAFGVAAGHGMQPHNLYAQTPAELGTIGVVTLAFMVWCFWRNMRQVQRLYAEHPWWERDFLYYVARSTWLAVVLLLFMGLAGHNLYRYNWMWFGAFQIIAHRLVYQRAAAEAAAPVPEVEEEAVDLPFSYSYAT